MYLDITQLHYVVDAYTVCIVHRLYSNSRRMLNRFNLFIRQSNPHVALRISFFLQTAKRFLFHITYTFVTVFFKGRSAHQTEKLGRYWNSGSQTAKSFFKHKLTNVR